MVSRETNHSLASNANSNSDRAMTVRSVLLKRDPASSAGGERAQHRRRHKTQQVRFKDLADRPEEGDGEEGGGRALELADPRRPPPAGCPVPVPARSWHPARPCSLTLPNPRKSCTSTAIQTSPSLQKQFPASRSRSQSVGDLGEAGEREGVGLPEPQPKPEPGVEEPRAAGTPRGGEGGEEEEEEGEREQEEEEGEREDEAALNGRVAETATERPAAPAEPCPALPRSQDREGVSEKAQDSNPNGLAKCRRVKDGTACKAVTGAPSEGEFRAPTAGQHCATKGVRNPSAQPCSSVSGGSPPVSKGNDVDQSPPKQSRCNKLKAPGPDLDSNHLEYRKAESNPINPSRSLPKDQVCSFPRSCLKTPFNPKQPSTSHRTDQSQLCTSAADPPETTQVKSEPLQPLSRSPVQSGEHANRDSQPGLSLHPENRLELVPSGRNPQANVTETASVAGNQGPKLGRTTQYEITSLQSRLQNMEDVLQTSQQTIKVLLDVIQDLEKKEAVRDGRQSYHTGQDIANCGTCRDCACIIYSVEHDFRQQEGRFHRVLSSLETEAGQSSEQPATPSKQDESPMQRQPTRTEPKKSKRKCFWFL